VQSTVPASAGTVILAALPIILGFQLLLTAAVLDVFSARTMKWGRRRAPSVTSARTVHDLVAPR
jgi:hypothetical protein